MRSGPRDDSLPTDHHDTLGRLIRVAFLVRLLALAFAVLGLMLTAGDAAALVLFSVLVLTSHLGLQSPRIRELVARHPAVALPDLLLVCSVPWLVGAQSPLTVVAVSSALLVGVLFALRTAVPLAVLLAYAYLSVDLREGADTLLLAALQVPMMLLSVAAIGTAVRRLAEQQRRSEALSALAMSAATAAQERLRLARDLHDTVAKSVQAVALTAAALPGWMDRDLQIARQHAESIAKGARQAVADARSMLGSLRLDDPERPLSEVVEELVCRWRSDHGLDLRAELEDVPALPAGHRHELLCAVSEALENVVRHAPGASVRVSLDVLGDQVVATVADDGPGFPSDREEEAVRDGHYGLTGMRERLASVGGSAVIRSAPGRGTEARFSLPIDSVIDSVTVNGSAPVDLTVSEPNLTSLRNGMLGLRKQES